MKPQKRVPILRQPQAQRKTCSPLDSSMHEPSKNKKNNVAPLHEAVHIGPMLSAYAILSAQGGTQRTERAMLLRPRCQRGGRGGSLLGRRFKRPPVEGTPRGHTEPTSASCGKTGEPCITGVVNRAAAVSPLPQGKPRAAEPADSSEMHSFGAHRSSSTRRRLLRIGPIYFSGCMHVTCKVPAVHRLDLFLSKKHLQSARTSRVHIADPNLPLF